MTIRYTLFVKFPDGSHLLQCMTVIQCRPHTRPVTYDATVSKRIPKESHANLQTFDCFSGSLVEILYSNHLFRLTVWPDGNREENLDHRIEVIDIFPVNFSKWLP